MKRRGWIGLAAVVLALFGAALAGPRDRTRGSRDHAVDRPGGADPCARREQDIRALQAEVLALRRKVDGALAAHSAEPRSRPEPDSETPEVEPSMAPQVWEEHTTKVFELEQRLLSEPFDAEWAPTAVHEVLDILATDIPLEDTPDVTCTASVCRIRTPHQGQLDEAAFDQRVGQSASFEPHALYDYRRSAVPPVTVVYLFRTRAAGG
jgi:hypothetical protein